MTKFVGEYVYSEDERRSHLRDFVEAMEQLLDSGLRKQTYPRSRVHSNRLSGRTHIGILL